jgi:hypothetical protein
MIRSRIFVRIDFSEQILKYHHLGLNKVIVDLH